MDSALDQRKADLILVNARVLTFDPTRPRASLVAVRDGQVLWAGDEGDLEMLRGPESRVVDCQGRTLLPGFVDAHLHLFAYAANLMGVDCSPQAVASIGAVQEALRRRASQTPTGTWLRGWGYEEFHLAERRHPNRRELDEAAPEHPVKLVHRSGHASVLNSMALARLGITRETDEPPGGVIERDWETAELTGYLLEMEGELEARGAPGLTGAELERGLALARERLLSLGITSIHEATPSRALAHWDMLQSLKGSRALPIRVYKMVSVADLEALAQRNLFFGAGDPGLSVGAVKIMLNEIGDELLPEPEELREQVYAAHRAGYQVAFHAVEERAIEAALEAVEYALRRSLEEAADIASYGLPLHDHRHRIEHCGVCPPALARRIASLRLLVVTQPAFIAEHGERYLAQAPPEKQPWLYPTGSLKAAGVKVAFGSDCPVVPPDPFIGVHAAVTRRARHGRMLSPGEAVSPLEALQMYTWAGAYAASDEHVKGAVAPGQLADLALLSEDPLTAEPERLAEIQVERTIIGGETVWER